MSRDSSPTTSGLLVAASLVGAANGVFCGKCKINTVDRSGGTEYTDDHSNIFISIFFKEDKVS